MSYIQVKNITKSYTSGENTIHALENINLEIENGAFTVILGPSGSGKSTLLNLIGGMDYPTSGEIIVDGKNIEKLNPNQMTQFRRLEIGFVFQFYNLIPNLTAFENVDIACRLGNRALDTRETLESMGLGNRLNNFPSQMSGGEQQRVSIARALCKNPKIMLCDEPTGALDSETGKNVLIELQKMATVHRKALIVVTHNAAIASVANRVIELKDGHVQRITDNSAPEPIERVVW